MNIEFSSVYVIKVMTMASVQLIALYFVTLVLSHQVLYCIGAGLTTTSSSLRKNATTYATTSFGTTSRTTQILEKTVVETVSTPPTPEMKKFKATSSSHTLITSVEATSSSWHETTTSGVQTTNATGFGIPEHSNSMLQNITYCTLDNHNVIQTKANESCNISAPSGMGIKLDIIHATVNWTLHEYFYIKTGDQEIWWNKSVIAFSQEPDPCTIFFTGNNLNVSGSATLQLALVYYPSADLISARKGNTTTNHCMNVDTFDEVFNDVVNITNGYGLFTDPIQYLDLITATRTTNVSILYQLPFPVYRAKFSIAKLPSCSVLCSCMLKHLKFEIQCSSVNQIDRLLTYNTSSEALNGSQRNINAIAPGAFQQFSSIIYLFLAENDITVIEDGTFQGLDHLEMLDLSNNSISYLSNTTFVSLPFLKNLYMISNMLRNLTGNVFVSVRNLEILYLDRNMIVILEPDVFTNLTNMIQLSLSDNLIAELDATLFHGLHKLSYLVLRKNQISHLKPGIFDSLTDLIELSLSYNHITELDAKLFHKLYKLSYLHIGTNQISHLKPGIFDNLTHLEKLYLSDNNLTELDGKLFHGLQKLSMLYLHTNQISQLKHCIFDSLTNLTYLTLSDNHLTELDPKLFRGLHKLFSLSIYTNQISHLEPGIFDNLTNLEKLYLSDNNLTELDANLFHGLHKLSSLYLDTNQISHLNSGIFDNLTNLEVLYLSDNNLTELDAKLFHGLQKLSSLYLHKNQISHLKPGIFDNLTNLIKLSLYDNHLTELNSKFFHGLHKLSTLYLDTNQISHLKPGIFDNLTNLIKLSLYDNHLTELNSKLFHGLHKLSTLYLGTNQISHLEPGIFDNLTNLEVLYLSDNNLTELDAKLFHGLHKLSSLYIDTNHISHLKPGIFDNLTNLNWLLLSDNNLTELDANLFHGLHKLFSLHIYTNHISHLKPGIFDNLTNLYWLHLSDNNLTELDPKLFHGLHKLYHLYLHTNQISYLKPGIFDNLSQLSVLRLDGNNITTLHVSLFQKLQKLSNLSLSNNQIKELYPGSFDNLTTLFMLNVSSNEMTNLDARIFSTLENLKVLLLNNNYLSHIDNKLFDKLTILSVLDLSGNKLTSLAHGTFRSLIELTDLYLQNNSLHKITGEMTGLNHLHNLDLRMNKITRIDRFSFENLTNLEGLSLANNPLITIESDAFYDLDNLYFVNLRGTPLSNINQNSFHSLNNNTYVVVDFKSICCFIDNNNGPTCVPGEIGSPYSTCSQLLLNNWVKSSVWIIGICALIFNASIFLWSCLTICNRQINTNMRQKLLITNLAVADLLMGIYMLIMVIVDQIYGENFPIFADNWRDSSMCSFAGFLTILSSEASLLFLVLISVERFYAFKYPYNTKHLFSTHKTSITVAICVWVTALILSSIPIALNDSEYGFSEVCIGLPLVRTLKYDIKYTNISLDIDFSKHKRDTLAEEPSLDNTDIFPGLNIFPDRARTADESYLYTSKDAKPSPNENYTLQIPDIQELGRTPFSHYAIGLFIGFNFLCCLIVTVCYIGIFVIVKFSPHLRMSVSRFRRERRMAIKMGLIIGTDLLCWMPVVILGILVQTGKIEISPEAFAWIIAFVLPINSTVNPFLYALGHVISIYWDRRTNRGSQNEANDRDNIFDNDDIANDEENSEHDGLLEDQEEIREHGVLAENREENSEHDGLLENGNEDDDLDSQLEKRDCDGQLANASDEQSWPNHEHVERVLSLNDNIEANYYNDHSEPIELQATNDTKSDLNNTVDKIKNCQSHPHRIIDGSQTEAGVESSENNTNADGKRNTGDRSFLTMDIDETQTTFGANSGIVDAQTKTDVEVHLEVVDLI
ncbi:uncharacterized protein [Amphiura filiformis]|uniref:uncharacterized protein n=1 Tax=Amphiura filiformis TaxID=82378 RepID=UPI003B21F494